jgi:thiol-disulfide isomerase/thioredoxin
MVVIESRKEKLTVDEYAPDFTGEAGDVAPDFELKGADGDTHSLADFQDYEALLIVFTCNHCPFAMAKVEGLNAVAEEFDDAAVVGINPNDPNQYPEDSLESMREAVEDGTIRYDAYLAANSYENQVIPEAYGAMCTPEAYLFENVDVEFRLRYQGQVDDAMQPDDEASRSYVRKGIQTILDGDEIEQNFRPARGCTIKWAFDYEEDTHDVRGV